MTSAEPIPALLARHAARRAAGVMTVSVLVGPVGSGVRAWAGGQPTVTAHDPAAAAGAWVAGLVRACDLPAAAVAAVADRVGRDRAAFAAEWRAKTRADAARFWDATLPRTASPAAQALADLAREDAPPSHAAVTAALLLPADTSDPFLRLREAAALTPAEVVPAVLFIPPAGADPADWLAASAAAVAGWAARLPAVPVAVAVPAPAWDKYRATAPDSRAKAVLREGVIVIPVHGPAAVAQALADAGLGADATAAAAVLAAGGATDDLVRAATDAVRANVPLPATPEADDRARSAAERLLFGLLESIPDTAGRFELNAPLDFRFGPRACEVDLLAARHRLAVEVDGYFHFRGPDDYRRDRQKDYELQRRGYFVLRFLADDVVRQIEHVRDRILEAVARPTPEGPP